MKPSFVLTLVTGILLTPLSALASGDLQRYALIAGANDGGGDRPMLKYAVSDAESFAEVLESLGGVETSNAIILRQPSPRDLEAGMDTLRDRILRSQQSGPHRTEVLVYYSGHADERGLLLGGDRYSYRSLRDRLGAIPADVRIAVLDACSSGAITRLKGGKQRPPFLVDESLDMRGHAFLTSSSADEGAQESDQLGASYFTHFLVSGLRGAADTSGEGKVTLNEAYQFAFNETLGHTTNTRGGAQHPSYDINITGSGDVVITDLRDTSATLALAEDLEGRVYVSTADGQLVVEMHKPRGRRVALGLEPGSYEIHCDTGNGTVLAHATVHKGGQVMLDGADFDPSAPIPTRRRGGGDTPLTLAGRNRLQIGIGTWGGGEAGTSSQPLVAAGSSTHLLATFDYARFVREDLAFTVGLDVLPSDSGSFVSGQRTFAGNYMVMFSAVGVRWNPLRERARGSVMRPYLVVGAGPVFGQTSGAYVGPEDVFAGDNTQVVVGGHLGVGVDVHAGRSWTFGVDLGANLMPDFDRPVGIRDNYSGLRATARLGWLFGRGHAAH